MADAGDEWTKLFYFALQEENETKSSLESRASDLMRGVGVIVTVLVAVAAFGVGSDDLAPSAVTVTFVLLAVLALVVSGALTLRVNHPRHYQAISGTGLRAIADNPAVWTDTKRATAQRRVAEALGEVIEQARVANHAKSQSLKLASLFGMLAIGFLAAALASETIRAV